MNTLAEGIAVERPPHDPGQANTKPASIIAEWPVGSFVENLLPMANGTALVAVHSANEVYAVELSTGTKRVFSKLPALCAGMVETFGAVFVNVGEIGQPGAAVYRLDAQGQAERWVEVPEGLFLNGSAVLSPALILVVDSIAGKVFLVNLDARTVQTWIDHEWLRKISQEPMLPGVNGVKVFGGYAYFSNTDRSLICKAKIKADGSAGGLEIVAERLVADDFAFDVTGAMYLTTHVYNSLLRLNPDGTRKELGTAEGGFAGSTSAAFGRDAAHRYDVFVTTTGGILAPWEGKVATGKLLKVAVGVSGAPI